MNTIEDLLKNHKENPSEGVWERLNAQLDAEMPVERVSQPTLFTKFKKVAVAALVASVLIGGAVLGWMLHQKSERTQSSELASTDTKAKTEEVAVVETVNAVETVEETLPQEISAKTETETAVEKVAVEKTASQPATTPVPSETTTKSVQKSNVRQEVLPANSTLAKQLAADPVLKNLSDDSVDWSVPTHLTIPNLFTPNGDNVNDLFVIEGLQQYASPKLVVRDKNNRIVYQNADYQNTWGGENCPDGIYSYEFTFYYNGIENQATGKVRIIRS